MRFSKIANPAFSLLLLLLSWHSARAAGAGSQAGRIITLTPGLAGMVLEVLPTSEHRRLVGVSEFSPLLPGLKIPEVASAVHIDLERIISLKPGLLLYQPDSVLSARIAAAGKLLESRGIRSEMVPMSSLAEVEQAYSRIGQLVGTSAADRGRGAELAAKFARGLAELSGSGRGFGAVLFEIDSEPLMAVAGGRDFLVELLNQKMGFANVFGTLPEAYASVSEEAVMARNPDWIIVLGLVAERPKFEALAGQWKLKQPVLKAVAAGQVRVVDADLLTRPGLSMLEGAKKLLSELRPAR